VTVFRFRRGGARRHPVHDAEQELEHLRETADEGECAATPAIVTGEILLVLIPLVAILIGASFLAYYTIGGGGSGSKNAAARSPATTSTNLAAGATLFAGNCTSCHGVGGRGGHVGPVLTPFHGATFVPVVIAQVTHGGGGMPAFDETLSAQQIRDVAAYVTNLPGHTNGTS
jgi:mono/diheme cytochrome c family protein